jgi:CrcB protein
VVAAVAVGGAVGALLRFALGSWLPDGEALALVGVGFCGALTTYSAFVVQTAELGRRRGTAYAVLTLGLSLGGCALGFALAQA